mmetsp:Transcript_29767/g.90105  ORF Transcript_29767/g.90105 Transcript_29767/m.90105 type:complete len:201 (+) Transcript_29767:432-1034(+)
MPQNTACADTSQKRPNKNAGKACSKIPFCKTMRGPKSAEVMYMPAKMLSAVMATDVAVPNMTIALWEAPWHSTPSKTSTDSAFDTPRITESAVDMIAAMAEQSSTATRPYSSGPKDFNSLPIAENADTPAPWLTSGQELANVAFVMPATTPGTIATNAATVTAAATKRMAPSDLAMYARWTMWGFKGNARKLKHKKNAAA